MPPAMERQLASIAKERGWSLSQTVIRLLEERFAPPVEVSRTGKDPIDSLAGSWSAEEAEEFDRAVAAGRQLDPSPWA